MNVTEFLIDNSAQGIAIFSYWTLSYFNRSFANIFGYTEDELQHLNDVKELFYSEDLEQLEAYNKARIRGLNAPINYECKGIKKDGSIIWLSCTVTDCPDEENTYSMHVTDITNSKKTHQELELRLLQKTVELKKEKESLKQISNAISVGIWRLDNSGELIFANNAYLEIFGRRWDEINKTQYRNFFHPDDAGNLAHHCNSSKINNDGELELRVIRPSGDIRYVKISYTHIEGENALVGTMIDITKKKMILPELQQLKEQLVNERQW